jgi:hypothetical protein
MRRLLIAATMFAGLGAGAAQAGPPVELVGWNHHHHPSYCYRAPVRYYQPAVRYYRPQVVVAPPCFGPQPALFNPYYSNYYPGNFVPLGGNDFAVQFGW